MARRYRVNFKNVTVTAVQDLVVITGATGKIMRIIRQWVGLTTTSLPATQQLYLESRFLPATITVGSGGTTGITPAKNDPGDAACSSSTCATNLTTTTTTSGTIINLYENGVYLYQGDNWTFPEPPVIGPSEAFVYALLSTVSGTVTLSGGVEFEEMGG